MSEDRELLARQSNHTFTFDMLTVQGYVVVRREDLQTVMDEVRRLERDFPAWLVLSHPARAAWQGLLAALAAGDDAQEAAGSGDARRSG